MAWDKSLWPALSPLLDTALELEGDARRDFLASLASESPALANALDDLLGQHERALDAQFLDDGWLDGRPGNYDVVATVNALHWFDVERAAQLVEEVHGTLRGGGLFVLAEPARPETPFVAGFDEWKARQPQRYTRENWERFWSRANEILGYDHTTLLGPGQANRIGDGMSVAGWIRLLERAGFELVDVLLRDADQVVIGALKSIDPDGR
ncbi:MAG: hypothetical protein ACM3SQ_08030 [Betaproteobacteria bacterium]